MQLLQLRATKHLLVLHLAQEATVDPNNSGAMPLKARIDADEARTRHEWEVFMSQSKMGQVGEGLHACVDGYERQPRERLSYSTSVWQWQ